MRIMHIDLDYIFDSDQQQQQSNIQALIQRIQQIQPNTIFLQAFADTDVSMVLLIWFILKIGIFQCGPIYFLNY